MNEKGMIVLLSIACVCSVFSLILDIVEMVS